MMVSDGGFAVVAIAAASLIPRRSENRALLRDRFHSVPLGPRGHLVEFNAGISGDIAPGAALYANVGYQIGLDGDSTAYTGKAGVRVMW